MGESLISNNAILSILMAIYIATKFLAVLTGINLITYIRKTPHSAFKSIAIAGLVFVTCNILAIPAQFSKNFIFQKIAHSICVVTELTFMFMIVQRTLKSKKITLILKYGLIISTISYFLLSINITPGDPRNYFFFALVSFAFIACTLSYFHQLVNEINHVEVTNQPETLLQVGVFFCNTLPLISSIVWISIYVFNNELAFELTSQNTVRPSLFAVAQIAETFCYFIFLYFVNKAFIWRKPSYT